MESLEVERERVNELISMLVSKFASLDSEAFGGRKTWREKKSQLEREAAALRAEKANSNE